MSSSVHTHAKKEILDNTLDLLTDTIKCMLLKSTYDSNDDPDVDFIDDGGANDPIDHEADCTGYTGGFAGAGRKTLASKATNIDDANNRVEFDFADVAFGALGNGTNNTLGSFAIIKEITNDAASIYIASDDVADKPTNGGTITYAVNAEGMVHF